MVLRQCHSAARLGPEKSLRGMKQSYNLPAFALCLVRWLQICQNFFFGELGAPCKVHELLGLVRNQTASTHQHVCMYDMKATGTIDTYVHMYICTVGGRFPYVWLNYCDFTCRTSMCRADVSNRSRSAGKVAVLSQGLAASGYP